jgi:choline-sulfatase
MNRRTFLASALATPAVSIVAAPPSARPNFLFIIADDLTFRGIRAMGNPEIETPHLDGLMKRGCTFTHAFHQGSWTGAVCIASRSMLNSGLTAFRAQKQIEQVPLWGQTMGDAGYQTSIVGKWHLSKTTLERSFQDHATIYMDGMFESGPTAYGRPSPGNTWSPSDMSLRGQWLHARDWRKAADAPIQHSAQIWADTASDRLAKLSKKKDPFLLYVAFTSPHDPRQAPKEIVDRYPANRIAIPPNYLPVHPFDQGDSHGRDELLAPFPRTREAVQLHRSEYYAHVTYLDQQVGRILAALNQSGKADNTYVIFTADHGLAVGQHGLMGKQNLYDHSTRMPFIVTGPGIGKGRRVDEMVYQHSVFATTCELAGVPIPKTVEFPSLANWLHGSDGPKTDSVFCWYQNFQRSVRTREHKLILYPQVGKSQIFDLQRDPWETRNVDADPAYAAVRKDLMERLRKHQKELGDPLTL